MDRVLTLKQVTLFVPYSSRHIRRLERAGEFPRAVALGPKRRAYLEREVADWLEEKIQQRDRRHTSNRKQSRMPDFTCESSRPVTRRRHRNQQNVESPGG